MFRRASFFLALSLTAGAAGCSGGGSAAGSGSGFVPNAAGVSPPTLGSAQPVLASPAAASYSDDFSADAVGAQAGGWTVVSGKWSVCTNGASHAYCNIASTAPRVTLAATSAADYTVDAAVKSADLTAGGVGVIGRAASAQTYYFFELHNNGSVPSWFLYKNVNGAPMVLSSGKLNPPDANPNYGLRLAFLGSTIGAYVAFDGGTNYQLVSSVSDSSIAAGRVGLRSTGANLGQFASIAVRAHAPLASESAASSQSFVDSLGMNVGLEYVSAANYPQVRTLIGNLGVRHYRVEAWPLGATNTYHSNLVDLHSAFGLVYNVLGDVHTTPDNITRQVSLLPAGSVESVEGPNEPDGTGSGPDYDPHFAVDVPAYMHSLYTDIKSNPATSSVAVLGPTFVNSTSYAAIGNISNVVDYGAMHDYFSGNNPGTTGFGANAFAFAPTLFYGSINWMLADAAQATGTKPVISTETGYCTAPIVGCGSPKAQAKYVLRDYFEHFIHKVPRTYLFELLAWNGTSVPGTFGIVSPTLTPTPAYNALAGMINLLRDTGAANASTTFNWSVDGQTSDLAHLLLHKANGTTLIPLWREVSSYNKYAPAGIGSDIDTPKQTVNVNIAAGSGTAVVWSCDPSTGTWSSQPVSYTNGSIPVGVSDSITIVQVGP